ncbi:hypothetical protein AAHA92_14445 [Salvia divinorum]|uniref:Uncharacterized protein n=1 Tax=Salvia divinorum TaxID=28513 RepID=A0ABD1HBK8_SALDI
MEAAGETKSITIDSIMPPRLEDAGLEDCALPPDSIREAFLKAASAVRSIVSASDDEGGCVEGPWEESSDEGCVVEKGGGSTEAAGDRVVVVGDAEPQVDAVVGPGVPDGGGKACVDGLQGLEIGEKKDDVADEEEKGDDEPTLVEGFAL